MSFLHGRYGLAQVRFTGGEPLLHAGLVPLIARTRARLPTVGLAMTTNGRLLARHAVDLRQAGLDRLNISLDSLDDGLYARITGGKLESVLAGIDAAAAAGFPPPRINCVVLRGLNDAHVAPLAEWGIRRGCEVRFLEAMPIGPAAELNRSRFVSAAEVRAAVGRAMKLIPLPAAQGETARRYRVVSPIGEGAIGFIAPISEPFCSDCRRMRLTATGRLFPCLLDSRFVDLSVAWGSGRFSPEAAEPLIREAVDSKAPSGSRRQPAGMISLGG